MILLPKSLWGARFKKKILLDFIKKRDKFKLDEK